MEFTIYGNRKIEINGRCDLDYQKIYGDSLTDGFIQYFADTSGCRADMGTEELTRRIENAIEEELDDMRDMPRIIYEAQKRGILPMAGMDDFTEE